MKRKRTLRSNGPTVTPAADVQLGEKSTSTVSKRAKPISKVIDAPTTPSSESSSPKKRKRRRKNYYNVTSQSSKAKAAAKIKQQKLARELSSLNAQRDGKLSHSNSKGDGDERQSTSLEQSSSSSSSLKRAAGDVYVHKKFKRPLNTNLLSSFSNSEPVSPSSHSFSPSVTSNSTINEKKSNFEPILNIMAPYNGLDNNDNDEVEPATSTCKKMWKPKFHHRDSIEHQHQQQELKHEIMNVNVNGDYNGNGSIGSSNIDDNIVKEKLRQSVNERINQIIYRNESILSQNNFSSTTTTTNNYNTTASTTTTTTPTTDIFNNKNFPSLSSVVCSTDNMSKLTSYSTINRLSLMSGGSVANESNNKINNSSISLPTSSLVSLTPLTSHSLSSSALLLSSSSVIQSSKSPYISSIMTNHISSNTNQPRFSGGEMLIKEKTSTTRIVPEYLGASKYRNPSSILPFFGSENIKHFTASTSTYRGSPYIETKSNINAISNKSIRQDLDSIKPLQLVVKKEKNENSASLNATCNSWLDQSMSNNVFQPLPINGIKPNYPLNFSTTSSFYTKPTVSTTMSLNASSSSSISGYNQEEFTPKINPISTSTPLPTMTMTNSTSTTSNIQDEASQSSTSTNNSHCSVVQSRSSSISGEKGFIVLESNNDQEFTYVRGRGRGKYVCESCGIRCKKPSMLRKHIKTHTDLRPYTCNLCNFSFKTKGNLTKHQKSKSHHKKVLKTNVKKNLNKSSCDFDSSKGADEKSNLSCEDLSMKKSASVDDVDDEDDNEMDDEDMDDDSDDNSETETDSDDNSNNNVLGGDGSGSDLQNRDNIAAQSLLDLSTSIRSTSANTNINTTTITTTVNIHNNNNDECPLDFSIKKSYSSNSNSNITPQKLKLTPCANANVKLHQPWLLDDQNLLQNNNSDESVSSRNSIIVVTPSKASPELKSDNLVKVKYSNSNDVKSNLNSNGSSGGHDLIETTQLYNKNPIKNIINNLTININGPSTSTSNGPIQGTSSSNLIRIAPPAQQAEFRQPNILQQEIEGKLECNICGKKNFNRPSQLTLHMNIHYLERPFRCDCGVSFKTKGHLIKHRRSSAHDCKLYLTGAWGVANEENPRPFKCPDCKIAFRIHGHLAKHLRSKMHIMRMECLGKLPFGIYFEMEKTGASLNEIDTTDCEMSLISLQILAQKLYGDDWRDRLCPSTVPEEATKPDDNESGSGSS